MPLPRHDKIICSDADSGFFVGGGISSASSISINSLLSPEALWKTVLPCGEQFPRLETFDFDAHFELQQVVFMPECIKAIDRLFGKFAHVFSVLVGKEICRDAGVDFSINDLLW